MCKHLKITVKGKVQGVWFRKYTKDKALELGLKGYVQNTPDGSVFIEVESNNNVFLEKFISWLHIGSPQSKVENVLINEERPCVGFKDFDIKS